ncbi:MAG: hypothetical protein EHM20_10565 [Alphaproteobacteria bacterium]|nr:MAG: hypothetical protein EHM20_10565 [Alphaproteobacteria bacterium]
MIHSYNIRRKNHAKITFRCVSYVTQSLSNDDPIITGDDDPITTGKIALTHINESPRYCTRL